jgi:hypothetical protein
VKSGKTEEAVALLLTGTKLLCEHQQYGSALELASVLLKTWTDNEVAITEENLFILLDLINLFPLGTKEFDDMVKAGFK